jgi:hypothetical protein
LPSISATILSPPNPATLSSSAYFSNDHYAGTSSPSSKLYASKSVIAEKTSSTTGYPNSVAPSYGPSTGSPADLQLYVDLSFYPLRHLIGLGSSPPRLVARQHLMALHPQQPKTILLTTFVATSATLIYRVLSPPNYKLIVFSVADRYEAWHDAMHEEIQVLRSNDTWSLVPFHHSINVGGN